MDEGVKNIFSEHSDQWMRVRKNIFPKKSENEKRFKQ